VVVSVQALVKEGAREFVRYPKSGYAESERVRAAQALGARAFPQKPVRLEKLARAIRAELDRPRGEAQLPG
jgi:hypothetical protein